MRSTTGSSSLTTWSVLVLFVVVVVVVGGVAVAEAGNVSASGMMKGGVGDEY